MVAMAAFRASTSIVSLASIVVVACSSGTTAPALPDGGNGEGGAAASGASCKESFAASQSLSAPCCVERGPDACGAGLFCATFDGRTQATCFPEHARLGGETCTADLQCLGNACHASGVCKGAPGGRCSAAIGCGTALGSDQPFACDEAASGGAICRACVSTSTDPACASVIPDASSPQPGKCPPSCTSDADCQATCPPLGADARSCCDTASRLCYASNKQCPLPPPR
jgi:hypothetical protein